MNLQLVALGFAGAEADHQVREAGGANCGPRIRSYLANCQPPLPEGNPWCAAFVQYCADRAAQLLHVSNPLDGVRLEAYVQSYFDFASARGMLVTASQAQPGDLVLFDFRRVRWDHIGFVAEPVRDGVVRTIEGNTNGAGSRDGEGVHLKAREIREDRTIFVRWAA